MYECEIIRKTKKNNKDKPDLQSSLFDDEMGKVCIKKTQKSLHKQKIAVSDDMNFCVEENIVKEVINTYHSLLFY